MPKELSVPEQAAYELLITDRLSAKEASHKLSEKGYNMTPTQLRKFKKGLFDKILREDREEHQAEYMLESFERTKIEFEDAVKDIKALKEKFSQEGDLTGEASMARQLLDALNTVLRVQGRFENAMMKIQAKNVNILSPPDLAQAFKTMQESWFENMDAKLENGKIVLENPSPELIDDFNRWQARQLREARRVGANESRAGTDS